MLALAELLTVAASAALAPGQDVSTASWFTLDGLGEAAGDYATALLGVAAWGSLGMALAVFVRSIPVALAIGIVWLGLFEHLLEDAWSERGLSGSPGCWSRRSPPAAPTEVSVGPRACCRRGSTSPRP